jgi:hypothetical protein
VSITRRDVKTEEIPELEILDRLVEVLKSEKVIAKSGNCTAPYLMP